MIVSGLINLWQPGVWRLGFLFLDKDFIDDAMAINPNNKM